LFDLIGLAHHGHGKRIFVRLLDCSLQIRGHLQQIGTFSGDLWLIRIRSPCERLLIARRLMLV